MGELKLLGHAEELLDVLDAAVGLIAAFCLQRRNQPAFLHNHLYDAAQVAAVVPGVLDQLHEARQGLLGLFAKVRVAYRRLGGFQETQPLATGDVVYPLDAGLANAAFGQIDDALGRDLVGWIDHQLQVGHQVADLGAVEEAGAADHAVGQPGAQQHVLQHPGLGVGAVEHREVAVTAALAVQPLHLAGNPTALVALVGRLVKRHRLANGGGGEQPLRLTLLIVGNHSVGGFQDGLGGAVVLLQLDDGALRVVALKLQDVADVRTAPGVDRLVVVAHHHDVLAGLRQQLGYQVLGAVGVLVLVNMQVAKARLVGFQDLLVLGQQEPAVHQQVVEVHGIRPLQPLLQTGVDPGDQAVVAVLGCGREFRGADKVVFGLGDLPAHRVDCELPGVDVLLGIYRLDQTPGIVIVVDGEVAGVAHSQAVGVLAQQAYAHRVEGRHPHPPGAVAQHPP